LEEKYLSTSDIAKKYNFTSSAVTKWIREGKLEAVRIGSRWRISENALQKFIEKNIAK